MRLGLEHVACMRFVGKWRKGLDESMMLDFQNQLLKSQFGEEVYDWYRMEVSK